MIDDTIYDSIKQEQVSFDEALSRILQAEKLSANQSVIYIGSGQFAIMEQKAYRRKKKKTVIIKKIVFEEKGEQERPSIAKLVPPSYQPEGVVMHSLYTDEEVAQFPDFD